MVELQKRHELNQQFAKGLRNLIERQTPPSPEPLTDPETSFLALLYKQRNQFIYWDVDEITGKYIGFGPPPLENPQQNCDYILRLRLNAAAESKWFDLESVVGNKNHNKLSNAALSTVRKTWIKDEENPIRQFDGIMVAGMIAANYLPENYNSAKRPKKHKHETDEEAIFRRAISILFDVSNNPTRECITFMRKCDEIEGDIDRLWSLFRDPSQKILRKGDVDFQLAGFSAQLIKMLASSNLTQDSLREEGHEYNKWRKKQLRTDETHEPPIEETKWTILPPGTMEEIAKGPIKGGGTGKYENAQFVDPDRMKWLAELALSWSPDAYIVVSNLKATGEYDYRAAILPQVKNGVTIEHAVAENPASKNAIYVFRAERGIDDDGSTWLTWKNVLSDNRASARALGARKIVHNPYVKENVMEYLTRKDEDLDKIGYRR